MKPIEERFWSKVNRLGPNDCWEWNACKSKHGYGKFSVARSKHKPAHRIAFILVNGAIPEKMCVCHRCDNPPCCNPAHLFLGTKKENSHDMILKGRSRHIPHRRSDNGRAKLTEEQVGEIRNLRHIITQVQLAEKFSVSQSEISAIQTNRRWPIITASSPPEAA